MSQMQLEEMTTEHLVDLFVRIALVRTKQSVAATTPPIIACLSRWTPSKGS
jgi:hypothetical protein